jgi:DNA-binding PadR family transcriptional regulator
VLELAILGLLKERPMHGYQLSRELSDARGPFWRVSFGSLYPSLRRLERDGAVESTPSEAKGRRRTVYRITPTGEDLFLQLLQGSPQESQAEDARFRVRLAFFRYLPPEVRIRLLERRRTLLQERLAALTEALRAPGTRDDYQHALMEHARVATESDIAWLSGLIQAERSRASSGSPRYRGSQRRATATLHRKERVT